MPPCPLILGLESSCDETAAAVVAGGEEVLSNVIATQHELHQEYAGVVPEIASRAHLERILPVIRQAMDEASMELRDLDAIAVGNRPGLIGSLLVAVSAAKALAWSLGKPLIGIDHVHAHLYAGTMQGGPIEYPALGLVVSGGHTSLYLVGGPLQVNLIGRTIDDAVGEAYDKAAAILEVGYPGGPCIDRMAQSGDDQAFELPVSTLDRGSLDFSFSGLKTALLYAVRGKPIGRGAEARFERDASGLSERQKADFAASFQKAAINAVMLKVKRALSRHRVNAVLVGGGVSANTRLRSALAELAREHRLDLRLPALEYCLDNAAMIAGLAAERYRAGQADNLTLTASARAMIA